MSQPIIKLVVYDSDKQPIIAESTDRSSPKPARQHPSIGLDGVKIGENFTLAEIVPGHVTTSNQTSGFGDD
ncbi:MAG TPA: hypothetical protein PKN33_18915 [Phycisphaerae bacterium]|nr:hypothetical protein [Phycisphaerae bacterium]